MTAALDSGRCGKIGTDIRKGYCGQADAPGAGNILYKEEGRRAADGECIAAGEVLPDGARARQNVRQRRRMPRWPDIDYGPDGVPPA
ncbi:MAG: hypothetical protein KGJ62_06625 [Armatimonadetes bacterium]|nr:hypothetical protein [Armatimonadota bacterium]MDE2207572.1 hypothetical protein [Armatimonadota bacterium]